MLAYLGYKNNVASCLWELFAVISILQYVCEALLSVLVVCYDKSVLKWKDDMNFIARYSQIETQTTLPPIKYMFPD